MATTSTTTNLNTLPEHVLLDIASYLESKPATAQHGWVFLPSHVTFTSPSKDIVSLAATSKSIRTALTPRLWKSLDLGKMNRANESYVKVLEDMLDTGRVIWPLVQHLSVGDLHLNAISTLVECIRGMINLEYCTHAMNFPVPTSVAQALLAHPQVHSFDLASHGMESLPSILPFGSRLRYLHIQLNQYQVKVRQSLEIAPIGVGVQRRMLALSSGDFRSFSIPSLDETLQAMVEHLAPLLLASRPTLEILDLAIHEEWKNDLCAHIFKELKVETGSGTTYASFPALTHLHIGQDTESTVIKHLAETSPHLVTLDVQCRRPMKPLDSPLRSLKSYFALLDEGLTLAPSLRNYINGGKLTSLGLNGIRPDDAAALFRDVGHSLDKLKTLHLLFLGTASRETLTQSRLGAILNACSNVEELHLQSGTWYMEVDWLFQQLFVKTPLLREFRFDHPWEQAEPRSPLMICDGRTIRNSNVGDFRIISVMGGSMHDEIKRRVQEDIVPVKPLYIRRFTQIAKNLPHLERVWWGATAELEWHWTVVRREPGSTVELSEESIIEVKGPDSSDLPPGIYMRVPPG